jgi:hypothetical protein
MICVSLIGMYNKDMQPVVHLHIYKNIYDIKVCKVKITF